jgi:hypothetical protein
MPQLKALCAYMAILVLSPTFIYAQASVNVEKEAKVGGANGKSSVTVRDVKFFQVSLGGQVNKWNRMQVEVEAKNNPDANAPNKKWLDKVKVTLTQVYKSNSSKPEDWYYYRSTATILTLEINQPRSVLFYLPGDIVKRDRLNKEPDFYFVQLDVAGAEEPLFDSRGSILPDQLKAVHRDISQKQKFDLAKDAADRGVGANAGILRPQYLILYPDAPPVPSAPEFIREDAATR